MVLIRHLLSKNFLFCLNQHTVLVSSLSLLTFMVKIIETAISEAWSYDIINGTD